MSDFARDTSLDYLKERRMQKREDSGLRVQKNRAHNTYLACIDLPDGHRETFEHFDKEVAIEQVKLLVQDYKAEKVEASIPSIDSDKASWTIKTDDNGIIAGMQSFNDHLKASEISIPSLKEQLASDMFEQEKIMAGLIEKAKRTGLDHRLIAMANTDFERGFMALDKALTTNKG